MTSYEVEIKAVVQLGGPFDGSSKRVLHVQKELVRIGAVPTGSYVHTDIYLSHPCRDFSETDEAFRIRCEKRLEDDSCRNMVTYKGPKISIRSKAREEVELKVEDPESFKTLVYNLGFREVMTIVKYRSFMELGEVKLCLDKIDGLGYFLEAEMISREIEGTEDKLILILNGIGLEDFERRSYLELLLEKDQRQEKLV